MELIENIQDPSSMSENYIHASRQRISMIKNKIKRNNKKGDTSNHSARRRCKICSEKQSIRVPDVTLEMVSYCTLHYQNRHKHLP